MDSINNDLAYEVLPLLRVYKDGRVERLTESETVPPSPQDPETGVSSKDITISPDSTISARLYLPKITDIPDPQKLPLLVYFHGGGFCIESAFLFLHHRYINILSSQAKVVAVSVEYRKAPEHPLPIAYEDCWSALKWVMAHSKGHVAHGEPWLIDHADFDRVFLGGDSAGANIVHNMILRAGSIGFDHDAKILGAYLSHPYFWGSKPIGSESDADPEMRSFVERIWLVVCPSASAGAGIDDPMINPFGPGAPSLSGLGCSRVLVCVAGKDVLKERGRVYCDEVRKSGWEGEVELFEIEGEEHAFHIFNPYCENAGLMFKRLASFLNY